MSTFVGIPPDFFCDFSLTSNVSIKIHELDNLHVQPLNGMTALWHSFDIKFGTLGQLEYFCTDTP